MLVCILQAKRQKMIKSLLLDAFYDNVNKNLGPTLMWVFTILLTVGFLYVMFKYLGSEDSK